MLGTPCTQAKILSAHLSALSRQVHDKAGDSESVFSYGYCLTPILQALDMHAPEAQVHTGCMRSILSKRLAASLPES